MYHHIMFGICVLGERDDQAMKLTKSQPLPPPQKKKKKLKFCFVCNEKKLLSHIGTEH